MAANKQCDGTECPGGCCPYVGWYCCPDGMYCAATAADCPFVAKKTVLAKMAANKQCDGTECPGGCCPYVGWYCCPDGQYCAATAADCPFVAKKAVIEKMAANKQLDGTAAQMVSTVLPLLLIVPMPKITFRNLLQE